MDSEVRKDIIDRKKQAFEMWQYAIQRIDLLIISICGAGIYVSLETLKYIKEKQLGDSICVKFAGGFFLLSIIINFISQFLGKKANEKDIEWGNKKLNASSPILTSELNEINKLDNEASCFSTYTNYFNIASLIAMFIGLAFLIYYFMVKF